jgi:hypothetical protein
VKPALDSLVRFAGHYTVPGTEIQRNIAAASSRRRRNHKRILCNVAQRQGHGLIRHRQGPEANQLAVETAANHTRPSPPLNVFLL